jgi:DNA-binding beta-propeller fold protein YncE
MNLRSLRPFRLILAISATILSLEGPNVWAQQILYGTSTITGALYTIDPSTGGQTLVGLTSGLSFSGLAFDPLNGVLYGETRGTGTLATIDPATGAATIIGPSGLGFGRGFGISFRSDGTLFALATSLYTINLATGQATLVGNTGAIAGDALAFSPSGTLYATAGNGLATVDPSTGLVTGSTTITGVSPTKMNAFAFDSTGTLFASNVITVSTHNLVTIDPATGAATTIGSMGAHMDGLAFAVPVAVPEPATWGFGVLTLVTVGWLRWRRR